MQILMYTTEDCALKNCNHIVKTLLFLTKLDMTGLFKRLRKKKGNLQLITLKYSRMHTLCQNTVGNSYSEEQLMHTFLNNFHQGGKYSDHIDIHQTELRREETFTGQK